IFPLAPGLFTTTMELPICEPSCCAITRATVSVGPPGANPTTMRTGCPLGQLDSADATGLNGPIRAATRVPSKARFTVLRFMVLLQCQAGSIYRRVFIENPSKSAFELNAYFSEHLFGMLS